MGFFFFGWDSDGIQVYDKDGILLPWMGLRCMIRTGLFFFGWDSDGIQVYDKDGILLLWVGFRWDSGV